MDAQQSAVVAEAFRRARVLDAWSGPARRGERSLPEALPAPIPPWWPKDEETVVAE